MAAALEWTLATVGWYFSFLCLFISCIAVWCRFSVPNSSLSCRCAGGATWCAIAAWNVKRLDGPTTRVCAGAGSNAQQLCSLPRPTAGWSIVFVNYCIPESRDLGTMPHGKMRINGILIP